MTDKTREPLATRIAKCFCAVDDNHWIDCGPKGRQAYLAYADAMIAFDINGIPLGELLEKAKSGVLVEMCYSDDQGNRQEPPSKWSLNRRVKPLASGESR